MKDQFLFDNRHCCDICHKDLPPAYSGTTCPACTEHLLFQEVKEYIRSTDVNEYQVADRFQIPLPLVRSWIREGRIQYKEHVEDKVRMHCQICGVQIAFGNVCPKCLKTQNTSGASFKSFNADEGNMRHLQFEHHHQKK